MRKEDGKKYGFFKKKFKEIDDSFELLKYLIFLGFIITIFIEILILTSK